MLTRQTINDRIQKLKSKGVTFATPYSQSDLKENLSKVLSVDSAITAVELLGDRHALWDRIVVEPKYPPPTDVDLGISDSGTQFSIQVKTFTLTQSAVQERIARQLKDFDASAGDGTYITRSYVGDELVLDLALGPGDAAQNASVGLLTFKPSAADLQRMRDRIIKLLKKADLQLRVAPGVRLALFDTRRFYDTDILCNTSRDFMREASQDLAIDGIIVLTFPFDRGQFQEPILAPVWARAGKERAVKLFRPHREVHLVRTYPFALPLRLRFDKPGWHGVTLGDGTVEVDGTPYGPFAF